MWLLGIFWEKSQLTPTPIPSQPHPGAANVGRIFMLVVVNALLIHWLAAVFYPIAKRPGMWLDSHPDPGYRDPDNWVTEYAFCYYGCMMMIMGDNTGPIDRLEVLCCPTLWHSVALCGTATVPM